MEGGEGVGLGVIVCWLGECWGGNVEFQESGDVGDGVYGGDVEVGPGQDWSRVSLSRNVGEDVLTIATIPPEVHVVHAVRLAGMSD